MVRRAALLLVPLLLLSACGDDGGTEEVDGAPTIDGAPDLVVVGSDFAFEPSVLHLRAGEPVNVVFEVSQGGHDLVVQTPEPFVLPIIDEGQVTRGGLQIDEPGTYEMICLVPGH